MRPTTDQIITSMIYSLDEYVIPHITDDWGVYSAKVMKHMLQHLRRRFELEGSHLAEEYDDLAGLLPRVQDPVGEAAPELAADIEAAIESPSAIRPSRSRSCVHSSCG